MNKGNKMWTSLEIAKLIESLLIPLVIVILGYYFNRRLKQIDQNKEDRHHQEVQNGFYLLGLKGKLL